MFRGPVSAASGPRREGKRLDPALLRAVSTDWRERSEVVVVEGAGGLMTPLGEEEFVGDIAADMGFPLIIVGGNVLGTINATLQTVHAATAFGDGLAVAGIILNHPVPPSADDVSLSTNAQELAGGLRSRCLRKCRLGPRFSAEVDWLRWRNDAANSRACFYSFTPSDCRKLSVISCGSTLPGL